MTEAAAEYMIAEIAEELRAFAGAVTEHLAATQAGTESREVIASRVVTLLDEELPEEDAASALLGDPAMMASFFQNADLLARVGSGSDRVARVVTLALERAWEG